MDPAPPDPPGPPAQPEPADAPAPVEPAEPPDPDGLPLVFRRDRPAGSELRGTVLGCLAKVVALGCLIAAGLAWKGLPAFQWGEGLPSERELVAGSLLGFAFLAPLAALILDLRERRRHGACTVERQALRFERPGGEVVVVPHRQVDRRTVRPWGLEVTVAGDVEARALLVPTPDEEASHRLIALLDKLEAGATWEAPDADAPRPVERQVVPARLSTVAALFLLGCAPLLAVPRLPAEALLGPPAGVLLGCMAVSFSAALTLLGSWARTLAVHPEGLRIGSTPWSWGELRLVAIEGGLLAIESKDGDRWLLRAERERLEAALRAVEAPVAPVEALPDWARLPARGCKLALALAVWAAAVGGAFLVAGA